MTDDDDDEDDDSFSTALADLLGIPENTSKLALAAPYFDTCVIRLRLSTD